MKNKIYYNLFNNNGTLVKFSERTYDIYDYLVEEYIAEPPLVRIFGVMIK